MKQAFVQLFQMKMCSVVVILESELIPLTTMVQKSQYLLHFSYGALVN